MCLYRKESHYPEVSGLLDLIYIQLLNYQNAQSNDHPTSDCVAGHRYRRLKGWREGGGHSIQTTVVCCFKSLL